MLYATPANAQDRVQVGQLAQQVREATGETIKVTFVDQVYTCDQPAQSAQTPGMGLEVVKPPDVKKGLCVFAPSPVRGAQIRPGSPIPLSGTRLRATAHNPGRLALCGRCHLDAHTALARASTFGLLNSDGIVRVIGSALAGPIAVELL